MSYINSKAGEPYTPMVGDKVAIEDPNEEGSFDIYTIDDTSSGLVAMSITHVTNPDVTDYVDASELRLMGSWESNGKPPWIWAKAPDGLFFL